MSAGSPPPPSQLRIDLAGWLNGFDLSDRTKGRDYSSRGCVSDLAFSTSPSGSTAAASVRGTHLYDCTLLHSPGKGWSGDCSCPVGFECKHLYAAGTALLHRLTADETRHLDAAFAAAHPVPPSATWDSPASYFPRRPAPPPAPVTSPVSPTDEEALVTPFTTATGAAPDRKQLAFLRHLLALHRSLHHGHYFDFQALQNLLPAAHRHLLYPYYANPFDHRWARPPATPLELWSHVALVFTEKAIPLPAFMAKLTDVPWARAALAAYLRERELAAWRLRFAALENAVHPDPAADAAPPPLRSLRLRLARKKPVWEISSPQSTAISSPVFPPPPLSVSPSSGSPSSPPPRFEPLTATQLRDLLGTAEHSALTLDPASASFAAILRAHHDSTGRSTLKLSDAPDRAFLGRLLTHPLARTCIVDDAGRPIARDPRRLIWQFHDHPTDPALTFAQLGFADGTPAPAPLIHLPAKPDLYLHADTLFTGLPPPTANDYATPADVAAPVPVPRAALALPEAGRFAARARLTLPGDTTGRFRRESLRPRLRASLAPRTPGAAPGDDVLLVELAALAPDGTPRALLDGDTWRRSGPGLPPPSPDAAFLILDFEPTRAALLQFTQLPTVHTAWHPDGPRRHTEITTPSFPETFSAWLTGFPPNTLIELAPELAAFAAAPTRAHFAIDLTPGAETGIDWFDVRVTLRAEDTTLTPAEVTILHGARGRFVRLPGHGWRRLVVDDSTATQEKMARLGLDPATAASETAREPLRFHALQLADDSLRDALPEKLWAQVRQRSAALRASPAPTLPAGLVAALRPYQHEGFHFLAFLSENNFGGVLADDMGLGKTLQTLAWLLHLSTLKLKLRSSTGGPAAKPFRVLVVCPKSVMVNWQLETARFAPSLTTTAFTSALLTPTSAPASDSQLSALNAQLLVANYTQLRLYADAFAAESWDAVILDEGQNIKNPASATASAARALRTAHRLVLTGTPVENRLLDLWSLFSFAQPGLLGGQTSFKRLYNDKTDPAARTRLAQRVKHFLLRRTKAQVARDLPARIEEEIIVELEGSQRALYDAELKSTRALLLGVKNHRDFDSQRFNILQSLLRLRQICCDPRLVGAGEIPPSPPKKSSAKSAAAAQILNSKSKKSASSSGSQLSTPSSQLPSDAPNSLPLPSAKLEALLDTLEPLMAEGHKVLVFSQFVTMLELIRVELTARGIAHLLLTGQTENRQTLVDKFQSDPAIPVFLLSLKAAGSGLNLTAASYVVLFDPWWNPAVEAQAIDRTHRIGQKNQVMAYRLIARNTVEEKIRALQKEKAALAAAVVQEESLATVLDLASLRRILA